MEGGGAVDPLAQARREIDRVDRELAELFQARMAAAAEIADWKQANGLPILDPAREQAVLDRGRALIRSPELREDYAALLEKLMALSRGCQARRMAGPDGPIWVRTPGGDYPIHLEWGLLRRAGALLGPERRVFLLTDDGVPAAYAEALEAQCPRIRRFILPQGEASKSLDRLGAVLEAMLDFGMTRGDCLAALGGGVVGDLGGLAASVYMRGIDFYNLPTTVLAMVDSSVGGKTAVDLAGVKNAVGTFYQPKAVLIDPAVLETLSPRQRANGLAEAVKMALTHDPALFARFEDPAGPGPMEEIIAACLRIKAAVVAADEREAGPRRVLNFGHTLGHGIEAAAGGALLHGECVGLGMLPLCAPAVRKRLVPVLERLGLPTYVNFNEIDPDSVLAAIAHDKKAGSGGVATVWVPAPGQFEFRATSQDELRALLLTLAAPAQGGTT